MGEVLIGTSGYSYEDWVGTFYPPGLPSDQFLPYYAERFPMTELNFSYYRQPSATIIENMVGRTPEGFRFAIKAHRSMTHDVSGGWRDDVSRFVDGIAPLVDAHRLLGVLLQFPYRFHYTVGNRRYLANLCRALEGLPLFLEFRHREWQRDSVYDQMRDMDLGLVLTDMPSLRGLPTSPLNAESAARTSAVEDQSASRGSPTDADVSSRTGGESALDRPSRTDDGAANVARNRRGSDDDLHHTSPELSRSGEAPPHGNETAPETETSPANLPCPDLGIPAGSQPSDGAEPPPTNQPGRGTRTPHADVNVSPGSTAVPRAALRGTARSPRHTAPPRSSTTPVSSAPPGEAAVARMPVPSGKAYIRFHGRNQDEWWTGDSTTRYDYRYSEEEIAAWLPIIAKLKGDTSLLVIAFNNHANGNAVANARQLTKLLGY